MLTPPCVRAQNKHDYDAVMNAIKNALVSNKQPYDYNFGSNGPQFIRLAFHASATFDVDSGTGGCNGAYLRYGPESAISNNKGLPDARAVLEPIKTQFPWISYADLYSLAGAVAVEQIGGEA